VGRRSSKYLAVLLCVLIAGALAVEGCVSEKEVQRRRETVLRTVRTYLRAMSEGDFRTVECVVDFPDGIDKDELSENLKLVAGYGPHYIDLEKELHLVSAPESYGSGDYLFLVPYRAGYLPRKYNLRAVEQGYRILLDESEFPSAERRRKTAVERSREKVQQEIAKWEALAGDELALAVDKLKAQIRSQITALEYAEKRKLKMAPGYGTVEERRERLKSFEGLTADQVRRNVLARFREMLAKMQ